MIRRLSCQIGPLAANRMIAAMDVRILDSLRPERICLIKPSAFGDVIQTIPLLPILRERFPAAAVSWVVNRELTPLLEGHPQLNEILPFDRRGSWRDWARLLSVLRSRKFDLVFDLQGLLRTGVMTLATRAPVRIGLETAREGSHLACHFLLPDSGRLVPAHRRNWRVAEALGLGDRTPRTLLRAAPDDVAWVRRETEGLRGPILAVQPGARWETKRWPVEKFAAVLYRAMHQLGHAVVIVGSPDEAGLAGRLELQLRRALPTGQVLNLAGQTTLKQLAVLLSSAELMLTNDSGPMHLAAGLGTPVVGLFTCTSPERSGPPGRQHALLASQVACAGSYCKVCPHRGEQRMSCLDELDVERVWRALAARVKELRRQVA